MVITMLAINNNSKTTVIIWLAIAMGVENMIAHHVHWYNDVVSHVF
jgi:hypothetical protein